MFQTKQLGQQAMYKAMFVLAAVCAILLLFGHPARATNITGDINGDGSVGTPDLNILVSDWATAAPAAELSGDSHVSVTDLSVLLSNWGHVSSSTNTLGNNSIGSGWTGGLISNDRFVEQFSMPQLGSITKLTYYVRGDTTSSQVARAVVYADSGGAPGALLAEGNEVSVAANQTAGWVDFSFQAPVSVPSGNVWIGLIRGDTTGNIDVATNTTGGVEAYATATYPNAPNPFGAEGGTSSYSLSGYATFAFESSGVAAPTVNLSASPSSISSGSSSTLTWTTSNATSCTASGAWSGNEATSGSVSTGNLSATQTYTLTCTGSGGQGNASTTVTVTSGGGGGGNWNGKNPMSIYALGGQIDNQTGLNQYSIITIDNTSDEAALACGQTNTVVNQYFSAVSVNTGYLSSVPWSEANSNGWLLKDSSGNLLLNQGYPSNNIADPGSAGYQQAWISTVESTVNANHCHGVFIDDAVAAPTELTGVYPAKYPSNAAWQAAMDSFFQAIGPALKADGLSVYVNASGYVPGDSNSNTNVNEEAWWSQIGPYVTGMMDEYFEETSDGNFIPFASTGGNWYDYWGSWDDLVGWTESNGWGILANMDQPDGGLSAQMVRYGMGSFLLEWNGNSISAFGLAAPGNGFDVNSQTIPASVGTPTAAETQPQTGVFERTYTNGKVIVNSTNSPVTQDGHSLAGTDAYIGP